jgi:hypothetical protein
MPLQYPPQQPAGQWFQASGIPPYNKKPGLWGISIPYLVVLIVLVLSLIIFAIVQFSPKSDTSGPRIYNVTVEYVSRNGAKITWYTAEPASTQIEYGLTNNYGSVYPVNPNNDVTQFKDAGVLYHELTISSLRKDTQYYFRAISRNARGNKSYSAEHSFKTKDVLDQFNPAE